MTTFAPVLQSINDVEESLEGAVTHFVRVADLTERLRNNVTKTHVCRNFYLSYAYTKVRDIINMEKQHGKAHAMNSEDSGIPEGLEACFPSMPRQVA